VIRSWRHKGLKLLYVDGDRSKIRPDLTDKAQRILSVLAVASEAADVDLPGFHLHPLKGDLRGFWSVTVSRNHRIIFRFSNNHVHDVTLIDYH
jgi:proteic killer suppression protein